MTEWASPGKWPPDVSRSDSGETIVFYDGETRISLPVPLLAEEVHVLSKPSASLCFPIHPLGVLRLFEMAFSHLDLAGGFDPILEDPAAILSEVWKAANRAYEAGEPLRSGIDRLLSGKKGVPSLEELLAPDNSEPSLRIEFLATYAVAAAINDWASIER